MSSDLEVFYSSVVSRLGIRLDEHNAGQIEQVLALRLRRTASDSVGSYINRFVDPDFARKELQEIAAELTVAETYFFRHPEHFKVLAELALPQRFQARRADRRLSVLSAGCAAGEEAYSLAVTLRPLVPGDWDLQIRGIDVNPRLVQRAIQATYTDWSLRTINEEERRRYFHPCGSEYALNEDLRRMVTFEERNLIGDDAEFWQVDSFDVVFCRNVMIYFSQEGIAEIANRLVRSLSPGGYLFLSPAETLRGITQEFHLRHTHDTFYYQKRYSGETVPDASNSKGSRPWDGMSTAVAADQEMSWADDVKRAHARIHALARVTKPQSEAAAQNPQVERSASPNATSGLDSVRQLLHQERFTEALRALDSLPRTSTADADTLLLQAVLLTQTGEVEKARETCRELLELDELNAGAHYLTAVCLEHSGDYLGAAEHDQTAAYLDRAFAMPHLHLGLLARRVGDSATAQRELANALGLLAREDASRILLFGGGFNREALVRLCQSHLRRCGGTR